MNRMKLAATAVGICITLAVFFLGERSGLDAPGRAVKSRAGQTEGQRFVIAWRSTLTDKSGSGVTSYTLDQATYIVNERNRCGPREIEYSLRPASVVREGRGDSSMRLPAMSTLESMTIRNAGANPSTTTLAASDWVIAGERQPDGHFVRFLYIDGAKIDLSTDEVCFPDGKPSDQAAVRYYAMMSAYHRQRRESGRLDPAWFLGFNNGYKDGFNDALTAIMLYDAECRLTGRKETWGERIDIVRQRYDIHERKDTEP